MLNGYKAYIGGFGALALGVYYLLVGNTNQAMLMLTLGMGILGIRHKQER